MRLHPGQEVAAGCHTLEWPWRATWVCQANPEHSEVATPAEEKEWELHFCRRRDAWPNATASSLLQPHLGSERRLSSFARVGVADAERGRVGGYL